MKKFYLDILSHAVLHLRLILWYGEMPKKWRNTFYHIISFREISQRKKEILSSLRKLFYVENTFYHIFSFREISHREKAILSNLRKVF